MAQYTTAQVAEKFATDARTLRKFLRADAASNEATDALPGKGSRYAIEGKDLRSLKSRFTAWTEAQVAAKATKDEAPADEVDDDAMLEGDAEGEEGPSDEDLAEIDAEVDA